MESLELNVNFCRICLKQNAILNWNGEIRGLCDFTYKDCYYKYTQLEILVVDPYSQMLCKTCSIDLKKSHFLILKALESHAKLQQTYPSDKQKLCNENQTKTTNYLTDHKYEPKYEPDEFEILIFEQNEETLMEENSDDKDCNIISKLETLSGESIQDTRKRQICKYKKSIENDAVEVETSKSALNAISLSASQEEISDKFKTSKNKTINDSYNKKLGTNSGKSKQKLKVNRKKEKAKIIEDEIYDSRDVLPSKKDSKNSKSSCSRRTYMCSICSKICIGTNFLKLHEATHNEHRVRSETCPHCGVKVFKKCLQLHLKTHNEYREKTYKCEFCNKAYFNMGSLNIHRRMHLGQMIPCPICPKEFFRQSELDRHNITAHAAASSHADAKKQSKYYVYCKHCNKQLRTTSWKAHQAAHLKEPLMKCSICDKDFFSRETCTYHMQKVHNLKTRDEYEQFILNLKPNRISHLLLEQQEIVKPITT